MVASRDTCITFDTALFDDKTRQAWARFAPSTTGILLERPEAGRRITLYESLKERGLMSVPPSALDSMGLANIGELAALAKQEERSPDSWYHSSLDSEVERHKEFHGYLHRPTNVAAADSSRACTEDEVWPFSAW